jgi:hypothetical protein
VVTQGARPQPPCFHGAVVALLADAAVVFASGVAGQRRAWGASAAPGAPGRQGPHPSTRLLRIRIRYERIDTKKRNEETLRRQDLSRDSATSPLRYPSALLLPSLSSFQDVDWIVPPTSRSRSRRGFQDSKTHQRSYDPTMPAGLSSPMTSLQFVIY